MFEAKVPVPGLLTLADFHTAPCSYPIRRHNPCNCPSFPSTLSKLLLGSLKCELQLTACAGAKAFSAVAAKPSVCVPEFRKAVADKSSCATPSGKKSADIILKELAQRQLEVEQQRMPPPQGTPSPKHMPAHLVAQWIPKAILAKVKQAALKGADITLQHHNITIVVSLCAPVSTCFTLPCLSILAGKARNCGSILIYHCSPDDRAST